MKNGEKNEIVFRQEGCMNKDGTTKNCTELGPREALSVTPKICRTGDWHQEKCRVWSKRLYKRRSQLRKSVLSSSPNKGTLCC